jgi:LytS/YehU family sensor histidine kinase
VEVEDDGLGLGGKIGQGVGLQNVRERLRALYGETARLDLSGCEPSGVRATIEVPA